VLRENKSERDYVMNKFEWSDEPGQTAFPVAKAGYPFIFAAMFTTAVFALLGLTTLSLIGLLVTFSICLFFRDPDRVIPTDQNAIVSPADGKVIFVGHAENSPCLESPCIKISIFMSVFNVHINRVPHEGIVKNIIYNPGKFFNAGFDKSSSDNERNAVVVETTDEKNICFVQIAGLIARRIICSIQPGDHVKRGQRMGLICFGSRVDVYLPAQSHVNVIKGNKVKGGSTILGYKDIQREEKAGLGNSLDGDGI
jgi:phosphatidylserine decarboxylase